MTKKHIGSSFDEFLQKEGLLELVSLAAEKKLLSMRAKTKQEPSGQIVN